MQPGAQHRPLWERSVTVTSRPAQDSLSIELYKRFRAVVLKAGYSQTATDSIVTVWFDEYMQNVPNFIAMLERYERNDPNR